MRREEEVRRSKQLVVRGERLLLERIDRGAADSPFRERADQGVRLDELRARGVDEKRMRLHETEQPLVHEALRLRSVGEMEGDDVRLGEELLERDERSPQLLFPRARRRPRPRDDAHPEGSPDLDYAGADRPRADDAQPAACELDPGERSRPPAPGPNEAVALAQFSRESECEGKRVLRDRIRAVARDVADDDAASAGLVYGNVALGAGACEADDAHRLRGREDPARDFPHEHHAFGFVQAPQPFVSVGRRAVEPNELVTGCLDGRHVEERPRLLVAVRADELHRRSCRGRATRRSYSKRGRHVDTSSGASMRDDRFPHLLAPLTLRGHRLRNRIVLTAHTTSFGQEGVPGARARAYYEARAAGGVGLIVMEPLPVHGTGGVTPQNYRFADDRFVPGLAAVVDAVRAHGATFVSQLYHLGPNADPTATLRERWGPSERAVPDGPGMLHAVDEVDIAELLDGHERAARAAVSAGVDGVECMFAYDTLVDGFMAARWNHRTDAYGGPLPNRMRLAREILTALRGAIGPDRLLGVTLSAGLDEYVEAAEHLASHCDLDYIAIGNGSYDAPHLLIPPMGTELGMGIACAAPVRAGTSGPAIVAEGRINHPELAERALLAGTCDLVGMTRALIADPDLPAKAARGAVSAIRPCIADNLCIARRIRKFPIACLQNPEAGFEAETVAEGGGRRVVVVGGGVAGLEAARRAAELGESVTLLERENEVGGQVRLLARLPGREEFRLAVDWRRRELARLGVDIRCGAAPSADEIAERGPDLVVVATGSTPSPSSDGVLSPQDVLTADSLPPGPAVVVDEEGNHKGIGVAELLAGSRRDVTLVAVSGPVGAELVPAFALPLALERLVEAGVRIVEGHTAPEVRAGHVLLRRRHDRAMERLEASLVVHAGRQRAQAELVPALRSRGLAAVAVGDARAPREVADAIREGYVAVAAAAPAAA